jgi:hypothetical protein
MKKIAYLKIRFTKPKEYRKFGIACDVYDNPLVFKTQIEAFEWWKNNKYDAGKNIDVVGITCNADGIEEIREIIKNKKYEIINFQGILSIYTPIYLIKNSETEKQFSELTVPGYIRHLLEEEKDVILKKYKRFIKFHEPLYEKFYKFSYMKDDNMFRCQYWESGENKEQYFYK